MWVEEFWWWSGGGGGPYAPRLPKRGLVIPNEGLVDPCSWLTLVDAHRTGLAASAESSTQEPQQAASFPFASPQFSSSRIR